MELKRFFSLIILSVMVCIFSLQAEGQKVKKVVIDAGHGGHDPGAVGKMSKEKDITLSIALKTGKFIEENLPDVEVIYTRKTDVFVELYRRAKIANEAKADLFISIHCNANKSTTPYGAETYVMGLHKSEANLSVAQLENASILLEEDYHVKYEGFDPTSPEGYIFFSMLQNAFLDQSLGLASSVQQHFKDRVNLFDRGVKQAGFLVLYKTTMPSILIETGFISNAKEERILASDEGQTYIASAIFRAVKDYKRSVEKAPATASDQKTVAEEVVKPVVPKPLPANDKVKEEPVGRIAEAGDNAILQTQPVTTSGNTSSQVGKNQDDAGSTVANGINPGSQQSTQSEPSVPSVVFKVQFLVSKYEKNTSGPEFKGLKGVEYYSHNGLFKYTYGSERTPESATLLIKDLNRVGFNDCFVVAFFNNERIDIEEAKRMISN